MSAQRKDSILIIGGGPAGLGAALAFHNNNFKNITILESRADMNFDLENSYLIGLNVRGQNAVKNLLKNSNTEVDASKFGLRIDQWKIIVGPGINVANFYSGHVYSTSRAEVTLLLYDEIAKYPNEIKFIFGHKVKSVDLESKTVKCEKLDGESKEFKPDYLVIADGYRSKARDSIAASDKTLKVQQWPWNASFRILATEENPKTDLDPYVHYIYNQIYISRLLNGRWTVGISIKENSPEFLRSNDPNDKNVEELEKYLKKTAPPLASLLTKNEYEKFFSRTIFSGAVTKVSKLVINDWAVLIGDAAHSAIPATGEGMNSALEDCLILQNCLQSGKNVDECLQDFEKERLEDVNALSDMAYNLARPSFKSGIQMLALGTFKKLIGPSKEDLLFGKNSEKIYRYSEVVKVWEKQTYLLGGPNKPKSINS